MNESLLNKLLSSDPKIKPLYKGIHCKDRFPCIEKGKLYVCQTSCGPYGEHFLVIERELTGPGILTWGCSYGTNPKDYPLIYSRIKETKCKIARLKKPLQKVGNDRLSNCSSWTLFFSFHLARGISLKTMNKRYFIDQDLYKLNIFIVCVIRILFHLKTPVTKLLFNKNFVESQERRQKEQSHGNRGKLSARK